MAWIYSDTVYCFKLWGFIQKVARHPIVIQFKMLLPNCIVLLRLSRHAFGEVCCCCVAVRPWTGQRPLDKSDNILSLFHEWIASDVMLYLSRFEAKLKFLPRSAENCVARFLDWPQFPKYLYSVPDIQAQIWHRHELTLWTWRKNISGSAIFYFYLRFSTSTWNKTKGLQDLF